MDAGAMFVLRTAHNRNGRLLTSSRSDPQSWVFRSKSPLQTVRITGAVSDVPRDFRLHGAGARRFRIALERFVDLPGRLGAVAVPDGKRGQVEQGIDESPAPC